MINLVHVQAFFAVAETLNFSNAAKRLNISQPALSKQIRLLEEELHAQLFHRNRRAVSLTPVGQAVLAEARQLLAAADAFSNGAAELAAGSVGRLRVGFVASATSELIPLLTLRFRRAFPRVNLSLVNQPTVQLVDGLRDGSLDLGIVRLPLREDGIETHPCSREPFAIVYAKKHPQLSATATVKDLKQQPFIVYSERLAPEFFQHWTGLCRRAGYTPRIVQEVAEMHTGLALVAAGAGVAILPLGITKAFRRALTIVPLRGQPIQSEIGFAVPKTGAAPLATRVISMVLDAVTAQPVR